MTQEGLAIFWFFIIGVSVVFYTVLDGFDLGVGIIHLFSKKDEDRRIFLNAIGPVWDGNEVWLVIILGGLLAGFPPVFSTLLSSFYLISISLVACLIFRAVAIEFRSKQESPRWRKTWDVVFSFASLFIAFIIGLILGNLVQGIPLNAEGDFIGSISDFFTPYPILIGILAIALFAMHGAIFLTMKTEGQLHDDLRSWINPCIMVFVILYIVTTVVTLLYFPHMTATMKKYPYFFALGILALFAIANIPREIHKGNDGRAFISSCAGITLFISLFAIGNFPVLIRSSVMPNQNSLTLYNSGSSFLTYKVLFIIVLIGIPLVLGYGFFVYRLFRGKVRLGPTSY